MVFCPTTVTAFSVDGLTKKALALYDETGNIKRAAKSVNMNCGEFEKLIQKLTLPPSESPNVEPRQLCEENSEDSPEDSCLDRLVLHVSNTCNLRCSYCYADGGSYGLAQGMMSREIAFAAVNWTICAFGGVNRIQFFGGEPLLNPRLIIEVCEYFNSLKKSGKIQKLPKFGIVTNGTLGNEQVIEMLRRYGISVTISIDGPKNVHDTLRGKGSFTKADRFAQQCFQARDVKTDLECTWTPTHLDKNISIIDLVDFFYERYGHRVLHVAGVSSPPSSTLYLAPEIRKKAFKEAAFYTVKTLIEGKPRANSLSQRVLDALLKREPINLYCSAGIGTLSVAADGGLYPCFMLAGDKRFRMCRFLPDGRTHENRAAEVSEILKKCDKNTRKDCLSCWAAPLCSGCIGNDFIETGDVTQRTSCETILAIAKTVLLEVAAAKVNTLGSDFRVGMTNN